MNRSGQNDAVEADLATDAEEKLLASILLEPRLMPEIREVVKPEAFLDYHHFATGKTNHGTRARIYSAMVTCDHPDMITLANHMVHLGTWLPNYTAYLNMLIANCATHFDWPYYARAVNDYYARRLATYYLDKGNLDKASEVLNRATKGGKKVMGGIGGL